MRLFGLTISRSRLVGPLAASGGWFPVIREPSIGAWQRNEELRPETALANPTVFACVTLIASDIGKVRLRLVTEDEAGIWTETSSPAFSPVLRKPNRAQTIVKFLESWLFSKLLHGNTYVLKERDGRGLVTSLYILDPARVTPLVTPDGAVYYQLAPGDGLIAREAEVTVPAKEIIHDRFNCLFHQLVGISPLFAGGGPAAQGQKIQDSSIRFFSNNARPSGVLTAPGEISTDMAARLKERWQAAYSGENYGQVAVLQNGLEYKPFSQTAVDSQLIEQDKRTTELICAVFHVPASLVDSSHQPPYGNSEQTLQMYYSQCLQTLMTSLETALDEGLELPAPYGTEFDIEDLYYLDTPTRTKAAHDAIASGALSPNEARARYFDVGPVEGGDSPFLQMQYWSLAQLASREAPGPAPAVLPQPAPAADGDDDEDEENEEKEFLDTLTTSLGVLDAA
jgi:HK97 family phage portal protein